MTKNKPETVLVTEIYVNGRLVSKTSKVIKPGPDWFQLIALSIVIPFGLWAMTMGGVFG